MRTLRFIVDGRSIKPDPKCDFEGLFPGTDNRIQAKFIFRSDEWEACPKVIAFWSMLGREYQPQVLDDENTTCMIPEEALKREKFKIQVIAKKTGYTIKTDKLVVHQRGVNR